MEEQEVVLWPLLMKVPKFLKFLTNSTVLKTVSLKHQGQCSIGPVRVRSNRSIRDRICPWPDTVQPSLTRWSYDSSLHAAADGVTPTV